MECPMSLFDAMRTSISGMAAQSNLLGTVSDNIANSATIGHKEAGTQFESLIQHSDGCFTNSSIGSYTSGSVENQHPLRYCRPTQPAADQFHHRSRN
jgi:flagellar hook protein FlgE